MVTLRRVDVVVARPLSLGECADHRCGHPLLRARPLPLGECASGDLLGPLTRGWTAHARLDRSRAVGPLTRGWTAHARLDRSRALGPLTRAWTAVTGGYGGPSGAQGSNGTVLAFLCGGLPRHRSPPRSTGRVRAGCRSPHSQAFGRAPLPGGTVETCGLHRFRSFCLRISPYRGGVATLSLEKPCVREGNSFVSVAVSMCGEVSSAV